MGNLVEMKEEWIEDAMNLVKLNLEGRMKSNGKTPKNFIVGVNTIPYYERKHTETDKAIMLRLKNVFYYPEHDELYKPIKEDGDYCNTDITFWCPKKFAWESFNAEDKANGVRLVPYWFIEKKIQEIIEKKALDPIK